MLQIPELMHQNRLEFHRPTWPHLLTEDAQGRSCPPHYPLEDSPGKMKELRTQTKTSSSVSLLLSILRSAGDEGQGGAASAGGASVAPVPGTPVGGEPEEDQSEE